MPRPSITTQCVANYTIVVVTGFISLLSSSSKLVDVLRTDHVLGDCVRNYIKDSYTIPSPDRISVNWK